MQVDRRRRAAIDADVCRTPVRAETGYPPNLATRERECRRFRHVRRYRSGARERARSRHQLPPGRPLHGRVGLLRRLHPDRRQFRPVACVLCLVDRANSEDEHVPRRLLGRHRSRERLRQGDRRPWASVAASLKLVVVDRRGVRRCGRPGDEQRNGHRAKRAQSLELDSRLWLDRRGTCAQRSCQDARRYGHHAGEHAKSLRPFPHDPDPTNDGCRRAPLP